MTPLAQQLRHARPCGPRPISRRRFAAAFAAVVLGWTAIIDGAFAANPPLQIWFVRHAQSEINIADPATVRDDSGVTYPLTRVGVDQAIALADALASTPILAIYTSTRLRAVQTADALAFKHKLPLSLAPEAVEIDLGVAAGGETRAVYTDLTNRWLVERDLGARHGEGESFLDLQRRFLPFVREIMNRHADDSGVVIIVTHSATVGLMVPMLATNVPPELAMRHPLPNTGIVKTELRDHQLICIEWPGLEHLEAELRHP